MPVYRVIEIATQGQGKKSMRSFELTIKNIPRIDNRIIIGYSNLSNLLSIIKSLEEFKTNNDDKSINILK